MVATAYKSINLPVQSVTTTWGDALNNGPFADIDSMIAGIVTKTLSNAPVTLTAADVKNAIIRLTGTLTANVTVTIPAVGLFAIQNATTGAFTVRVIGSAGGAKIVAQGMSTIVHIDATNGAFLAGARASTVGMIGHFVGTTIPGGWVEMDGSLLSRTDYAELWAYAQASGNIQTDANWTANNMIGCFSSGDGTTNFRIPDGRGIFVRNWAHGGTHDSGRLAGQGQADAVLNHVHPAASAVTDPGHVHPYTRYGTMVGGGGGSGIWYNTSTVNTQSAVTGISVATTISNNTGGSAADNRPYNIAELCCISYL